MLKFALILLLIATASAETVQIENYSISFDVTEPHQIEKLNDSINIKTFNYSITVSTGDLVDPYFLRYTRIGHIHPGDLLAWDHGLGYMYLAIYSDYWVLSSADIATSMEFLKTLRVERTRF